MRRLVAAEVSELLEVRYDWTFEYRLTWVPQRLRGSAIIQGR